MGEDKSNIGLKETGNEYSYKSKNFSDSYVWIKRILFIGAFFTVIFGIFGLIIGFSFSFWLITSLLFFLIIVCGRMEDVTISNKLIVIENKSIIPFFKSRKEIFYSEIKEIKKVSDIAANERGRALSRRIKNTLQIELYDDSHFKIRGSIHEGGIDSLFKIVKYNLSQRKK